jgi:hypothetical protein
MTGRAAAMQPGAVNATMAAALAGFAHLGPRVMSSFGPLGKRGGGTGALSLTLRNCSKRLPEATAALLLSCTQAFLSFDIVCGATIRCWCSITFCRPTKWRR